MFWGTCAQSATLHPVVDDGLWVWHNLSSLFDDMLIEPSRDRIGTATEQTGQVTLLFLYGLLMLLYARFIAKLLPRRSRITRQQAMAAFAVSRMRSTIDRKPFERCADR